MATITILDTPVVTVWYHTDKKIVHHQIHKFVSGSQFRQFLTAGAEVLEKYRASKWLSDDRGNSVLAKDDVEWSQRMWAPRAVRAGWKYWAIVQPGKVLAQVAMERLVEEYSKQGVTAKFFSDVEQATKWLESM